MDLELLRRRVERTFGDKPPVSAVERVRSIVGPQEFPGTSEGVLAAQAMAKLKDPDADKPTPRELAALEMMLRMMRPAPKYQDDVLDDLAEPEFRDTFRDWEAFRAQLQPLKMSIGRVDAGPDAPAGTGFLVSDDALVTNRHVLDAISRGTRVLETGQATVWFAAEIRPAISEGPQPIDAVIAFDTVLDIALLRVRASKRMPLTIRATGPAVEDQVVTVGHPFNDSVNNPLFTRTIFGDTWGVKRAAPGEIITESSSAILGHDCSTLGGNSGSPLLSLQTAEVVGLHFSGSFLWRNEAINGADLKAFVDRHV